MRLPLTQCHRCKSLEQCWKVKPSKCNIIIVGVAYMMTTNVCASMCLVTALNAMAISSVAAGTLTCHAQAEYHRSSGHLMNLGGSPPPSIVGNAFVFDRNTGQIYGTFRPDDIRWRLIRRGSKKHTWIFIGTSDRPPPTTHSLSVMDWHSDSGFLLVDLSLGIVTSGICE